MNVISSTAAMPVPVPGAAPPAEERHAGVKTPMWSGDAFEAVTKKPPSTPVLPPPAPLPSTPLETLYTDPFHQDTLGDRLAALIGTAKKTLDGAFYEIADPRMLSAFEAAAGRGVKVRLVTDNTYYRSEETATELKKCVTDLGKVNDYLLKVRHLKPDAADAKAAATTLLAGFDDIQAALLDAKMPDSHAIDLQPVKEYLQLLVAGTSASAPGLRSQVDTAASALSSNVSAYRVRMLFRPSYDGLLKAGVQLRNDDSDKLSHNKYLVLDNKTSWVGSYNIQGLTSDSGSTVGAPSTADNAVILPSATLAKVFEADFKQMFVDGKFHNDKVPEGETEIPVNGVGVTPYTGPEGSGFANLTADLGTLLTQMRAATAAGKPMTPAPKIRVAAFSTSYNGTEAFVDMLKLLHREGADVQVIADSLGGLRAGSGSLELKSAGIPVMVTTSDMMLHHKFFTLDAGKTQLTWTGSANWTHPAFFENDETELRLDSPAEVKAYEAIWDTLKAHLKPSGASLLAESARSGTTPDDPNSIQTLDDAIHYAQRYEA